MFCARIILHEGRHEQNVHNNNPIIDSTKRSCVVKTINAANSRFSIQFVIYFLYLTFTYIRGSQPMIRKTDSLVVRNEQFYAEPVLVKVNRFYFYFFVN